MPLEASTLKVAGGYEQLAVLGKPFAVTEIGPPQSQCGALDGLAVLGVVRPPPFAGTRALTGFCTCRRLLPTKTVSCTEARNQLAGLMERATQDREPIGITRNGVAAAVLIDAEEFAAMEATLHLLSTPANAERIRQGLADDAKGKLQAGELCD